MQPGGTCGGENFEVFLEEKKRAETVLCQACVSLSVCSGECVWTNITLFLPIEQRPVRLRCGKVRSEWNFRLWADGVHPVDYFKSTNECLHFSQTLLFCGYLKWPSWVIYPNEECIHIYIHVLLNKMFYLLQQYDTALNIKKHIVNNILLQERVWLELLVIRCPDIVCLVIQ